MCAQYITTPRFYFYVLHWWCRGKRHQKKNLYNIIWYLKRNNCAAKTILYSVLVMVKGINMSWCPLINFVLVTFSFGRLFVLTRFHSVAIFNGFIILVRVMFLYAHLNFHLWWILICVCCLTCWGVPQNCLLSMIIPNVCVSRAEVMNDFGLSFLCQIGRLVYVLWNSY